MAGATVEELAFGLYVDVGDVLAVLSYLGEPEPPAHGVITQDVCDDVVITLDPWPMVRRIPDRYR